MSRLDAALEAAERGWQVFPVFEIAANGTCACGLKCGNAGKHPRVKWSEEATTDEWKIRDWWTKWPEANLGIATGKRSGLWVLDIDTKGSTERADGTLVPEGEFTLRQLESEHDTLPDTLVARTGSGGQHHYFAYPGTGDHPNRVRFAPGLDIRGDGGYVVAPGSNHLSGHDYVWLDLHPLAPAPGWLVERSDQRYRGESPGPGLDQPATEGGRNDYLTRWAGKYRSADPELGEGGLFDLLWSRNLADCKPPLEDIEVGKIAKSAMRFAANAGNEVDDSFAGEQRAPPEIPEGADLAWSIKEFMALTITPPEPLVHNLIDAGTGIMVAGPGGIGKSWLTMHLALALATGTPFLDHWETERCSVLLIDEEGHPFGNQERFAMLINGHEIGSLVKVPLYLTMGTGMKLDTPLGVALLQRMIGRYQPKIVIFDSLVRVSSGEESNAREMANFFAVADVFKRTSGTAFLFVHHCRKPGNEMPADLGDLVRGSTEIKNWLDTLFICLAGETSTDMTVHVNKQRWHKQPEHPFVVRLLTREDQPYARLGYQGDTVKVDTSRVGTQNRIMFTIQDLIKKDLEATLDLISANVNLSKTPVKGHLDQLVAMGLLAVVPSKFKRQAYAYLPTGETPPPKMNGAGSDVLRPGGWSMDS